MDKKKVIIVLGTAHLATTPGKGSPDGKFKEYKYSREMVKIIKAILTGYGYKVLVDYEDDKLPKSMQTPSAKLEQSRELGLRVNYVNEVCRNNGSGNVLYISIHCNAAGADDKWHDARGWSVYTSPGRTKSDDLATCIWNAAKKNLPNDHKNALRADWSDKDPDYESSLYVLTHTKCPAVLTENLFQDNKDDVAYLTSDAGIQAISRLHVEGIIDFIERF